MKQHVNRVASSCFFHLRRLRQIKRHVTPEAMNQLVAAVILGRLDYCNAVLAGLPWSTVAPLQRVQNAAARLVLGLSPRDHVSSALVDRGVNGGGDGGMHPLQHFGQGDAMPLIPPLLLLPF